MSTVTEERRFCDSVMHLFQMRCTSGKVTLRKHPLRTQRKKRHKLATMKTRGEGSSMALTRGFCGWHPEESGGHDLVGIFAHFQNTLMKVPGDPKPWFPHLGSAYNKTMLKDNRIWPHAGYLNPPHWSPPSLFTNSEWGQKHRGWPTHPTAHSS